MRVMRPGPFLAFGFFFSLVSIQAQQSPTLSPPARDPQALTILTQYVQALGGLSAIASIQDYTASGAVTFNWAGQQVQGTVTVKGRGTSQFRMDSNTSEGNESWIADGLSGTLTTINGKTQPLAPYNLVNAGSLTLPVLRIAAALNNQTTAVHYMGQVTQSGRSAYQVRLVPAVDKDLVLIPDLTGAGTIDLFIDGTTYQLLAEVEAIHDSRNIEQTYTQELDFSNYQMASGTLVPLAVAEKFGCQLTWSITLSNINFNTGLSDADFTTNAQ